MSALGERLRQARESAGLSTARVRDRMGWSSPTVLWRYEQGLRVPSKERIEALGRLYDVSAAWLMLGTSSLTKDEEADLRTQFGALTAEDQEKAIAILRSLRKGDQ